MRRGADAWVTGFILAAAAAAVAAAVSPTKPRCHAEPRRSRVGWPRRLAMNAGYPPARALRTELAEVSG